MSSFEAIHKFYEMAVVLTLSGGGVDSIKYEHEFSTHAECVQSIADNAESIAIIINDRLGDFVKWDVKCTRINNI